MCKDDKRHKISVAYDLISRVCDDTDEDTWAQEFLIQALGSLNEWFEEEDLSWEGRSICIYCGLF